VSIIGPSAGTQKKQARTKAHALPYTRKEPERNRIFRVVERTKPQQRAKTGAQVVHVQKAGQMRIHPSPVFRFFFLLPNKNDLMAAPGRAAQPKNSPQLFFL
jgi:hypothetical protein